MFHGTNRGRRLCANHIPGGVLRRASSWATNTSPATYRVVDKREDIYHPHRWSRYKPFCPGSGSELIIQVATGGRCLLPHLGAPPGEIP